MIIAEVRGEMTGISVHKKFSRPNNMDEVRKMKKKDEHRPHELKDQPVPHVKGAVTELPEDILIRPNARQSLNRKAGMEDTVIFDGWM